MILNIILIIVSIGVLILNYQENKEINKFITYGLLLSINIILLLGYKNFILNTILIILIILFVTTLIFNYLKNKNIKK